MDASPQLSAASLRALLASASTTLAWMTDPHTQQFTYTARDADAAHAGLAGGSSNLSLLAPLRALATAAAAGALVAAGVTPSARVAQTLLDATAATLRAIAAAAVANSSDGAAFLSARAMGECSVSTIAHSGMFILALARAPPDVAAPFLSLVEPLAEGVARQQRSDGTFQARMIAPRSALNIASSLTILLWARCADLFRTSIGGRGRCGAAPGRPRVGAVRL